MPRRNAHAHDSVSQRHTATAHTPTQPTTDATTTLVPLNRATPEELERLPGVGPALAARIVEHRERHGPFRRPEHLLLVRGISERRLRELRRFITTD